MNSSLEILKSFQWRIVENNYLEIIQQPKWGSLSTKKKKIVIFNCVLVGEKLLQGAEIALRVRTKNLPYADALFFVFILVSNEIKNM